MTTARKAEEKMVGDHNRPLGLILETFNDATIAV
jgi:hypothetical protein